MSVSCEICGKGGFLNDGEMVGHLNIHSARMQLEAERLIAGAKNIEHERACKEIAVEALQRLADCDWVITLPDRMDAVRAIAREAIAKIRESEK